MSQLASRSMVQGVRIALQEASSQNDAATRYDVEALRSMDNILDSGAAWDDRVRATVDLLKKRDAARARAGELLAHAERLQRFSDL